MAKRYNKNNILKTRIFPQSTTKVDNEYDLEKNIKKINSYSRINRNAKDKLSCNITDSQERGNLNSRSNDLIKSPHMTTTTILTGDNGVWKSYTRLDDKITDFNYKNDQAHTELRKELEDKIKDSNKECKEDISKKLDKQWYVWTIVGLVAIVGIWYMFSYIEVHPLPSKVEDIDTRLNTIESKVDKLTIDSVKHTKINKNK